MQKDEKNTETLSPEAQETMRALISAIRTVKLYPPNNPIYSQSVKKSFEALDHFLATEPDYVVGVQKNNFTCRQVPVGKEGQLNKAIAQDLFAKGIREITFTAGVTETELLDLCNTLALSSEELAIRSGITSVLWEKGVTHITIDEAGLDEVVATKGTVAPETGGPAMEKKKFVFTGSVLLPDELIADPRAYGAALLEHAKETRGENESVEDRLFTLYQEAGQAIQQDHADRSDALFEGLAESALSLESPHREDLIGGRLYGALDAELIAKQTADVEEHVPSALHEVQTARFSRSWTTPQVATLLKQAASKAPEANAPSPAPAVMKVDPLPEDIDAIAKEMEEYGPEEMEELQALGNAGVDPDIVKAATRTLLSMMPLVKHSPVAGPEERDPSVYSGLVRQLEDLLTYSLEKKEYEVAGIIVDAFHQSPDPDFEQHLKAALEKASSRTALLPVIESLRKYPRNSDEYRSAHSYVSVFRREALEIILELLAEEEDRRARFFLLDLVKEFGKDRIEALGAHLADGRWHFVRNIVNILGESRSDEAVALLRKVANHPHIRVRQEVIKALVVIGGKKSAAVLTAFLQDKDTHIRMSALRSLGNFPGIGAEGSATVMTFLENLKLSRKDRDVTLEAIAALGKIGGPDAGQFLERYTRVRWWKSRKLQKELGDAARRSMETIERRVNHAGR